MHSNNKFGSELISVIHNFEKLYFVQQAESLDESLSLFKNNVGKLWVQCGLLVGIKDQATLHSLEEAAALYQYLQSLQQLNIYLTESRCIIPASCSNQSSLLELRSTRSIETNSQDELFSPLINEINNRLRKSEADFDKKDQIALRHVIILIRLAATVCEEILQNKCQLLNSQVSLTPLRRLWIAWYTHLQIKYF